MSLFKQLTILITIFLIIMSSVLLWFILTYNKSLLENQLSSNAKNSASFLGLSISKNVDFNDTATLEGMISSIVDNGFYEHIAIYDNDAKEIVKLSSPKEELKSPDWFSNMFAINIDSSSADIMQGWMSAGNIEVKIAQSYANNRLWETFKAIAQIFMISTVILLVLFYFFIDRLLKPLRKLSIQAKAIDNNEFIIERELPYTLEFQNVTKAMNKTITKMEAIFTKEVETLNKYNELLYKHEDTGLGNRNYLILKLNNYLKNSHGLLLFVGIKEEIAFKKRVGYKTYMDLKQTIIKQIHTNLSSNNMILSILNDGTLAILLPNIDYEDNSNIVENIYKNIYTYIEDKELNEIFDINVALGIASYSQNTPLSKVLSKADQALNLAMQKDNFRVEYVEDEIKFTKKEWIELLEWAFENDTLFTETQNIVDIENNVAYMKEFYIRLKDKKENIYLPGEFLSVVSSMGWMEQLEKRIIEKIFEENSTNKDMNDIVINLTTNFVLNRKSVNWLVDSLVEHSKNSNSIFYFECINKEILNNLEDYKYFVFKLNETKHKFAIESFSFENKNLDYLKELKPRYIKISKLYFTSKQGDITNTILSNIVSTIGAELMVKHVENEEEYNILKDMGIRYMQGKYIDKMEV